MSDTGKANFSITKEQMDEIGRAHGEFHHAYGCAMAQWGGVERALSYWFVYATRMKAKIGEAVFFSARSFNGRVEMLEAAIEKAENLNPAEIAFLKAAVSRSRGYSGFRNRMAHGQSQMQIVDRFGQPRQFGYAIVDGASDKPASVDIGIEDLMTAERNFHALRDLMMDSHPKLDSSQYKSPEEALRLVTELPSQANSKNAQNPSERKPQPQGDGRVNKKEYRAAHRQPTPDPKKE